MAQDPGPTTRVSRYLIQTECLVIDLGSGELERLLHVFFFQ